MVKGFVILCDTHFRISSILYNSFSEELELNPGSQFQDLTNGEETLKVAEFIDYLKKQSAIFNWELNIDFSNKIVPLKFSGGRMNEQYFLFGLETNSDIPFLYEELMKINNDQANYLRGLVKDKFVLENQVKDHNEVYDELSRVNNELANLQRELFQKNHELQRLNDLKNQFLGMAAHDLRNPLSNILFYMDFILEDGENLTAEQKDFSGQVITLSKFMLNMVNDLLDVSVIEKGKVNLKLKKTDISSLLEDVIRQNIPLAQQKQIETEINIPKISIGEIFFDSEKIKQVIINLYSNAIKYSESGTCIKIEIKEQDEDVLISVRDQGQGIAENELGKLFQAFQKTSSVATQGEKSTGLGLFIVKRIVLAHGGNIWAESEPGKGSVFSFTLPKQINQEVV